MKIYNYDRKNIRTGIVHFGVGNFHRAHLEYYTNLLLEDPSQQSWGVFGAMIMPSDGKLFNALKDDDCTYELSCCSPSGETDVYTIGSLIDIEWGEQDSGRIIAAIASPDTKIITLTITEGGYNVDLDKPKSVFWYIAEGLTERMKKNLPVTILSCDNLQHNGDTAHASFMAYFTVKYPEVAKWAQDNVTFPNSMVDRITPVTKCGKVTDVKCEDFVQWVIEDKFIAGRPQWENVGVQFTNDVAPYENMKLSLLNGSHSLLCYGAYLEGYRKVDDVMADERYTRLLREFMNIDVTPFVPAPEGIDLENYKETLIQRFSNPVISDQVSRLCADGIARFAVYIVPTLKKMLKAGMNTERLAFHFANYFKYLTRAVTESGEKINIDEPHMSENDRQIIERGNMMEFFKLTPFADIDIDSYPKFIQEYDFFISHSVADGLNQIFRN